MKKVVVKCTIHDDKSKQKAMKAVSTLTGIDSISADTKDGKLTIIGDVDPVMLVGKLRAKKWSADIVSVGPAKEEKKEEKKPEEKKPEEKKEDPKKKEEDKKKEMEKQLADLVKAYQNFNPHMTTQYYVQSVEDNPNGCFIL